MTKNVKRLASGPITGHALRLTPGTLLMKSLKDAAESIFHRSDTNDNARSVFIITAVGSLSDTVTLRMANADASKPNPIKTFEGERFEIVSMTGTFARDRKCHVHISLSRSDGAVIGGHLVEGKIFTTCELVLGSMSSVEFRREQDNETGFTELVVRQIEDGRGMAFFEYLYNNGGLCFGLCLILWSLLRS